LIILITVNDTLGHDAGDKLLKTFSRRLKKCVRKCDLIARLGGDEFIIILKELKDKQDGAAIAEKILSMPSNYNLNFSTIKITTSIGMTFYSGEQLRSKELVRQADQALYISKNNGRNTLTIYKQQ
jgi:diguanylate cyclase (GGDEF)-like protein